jgi:hypothetical protein
MWELKRPLEAGEVDKEDDIVRIVRLFESRADEIIEKMVSFILCESFGGSLFIYF